MQFVFHKQKSFLQVNFVLSALKLPILSVY